MAGPERSGSAPGVPVPSSTTRVRPAGAAGWRAPAAEPAADPAPDPRAESQRELKMAALDDEVVQALLEVFPAEIRDIEKIDP